MLDLDKIKKVYDGLKSSPGALEDFVVGRLMDRLVYGNDCASCDRESEGIKVIFSWDDNGKITDMRFERVH